VTKLILQGRSSSHFTRTARIFALELEVPHTFRPVLDLTSLDPASYADNPALKIPILIDEAGPLFGTENICRELARRSSKSARCVLRGACADRLVANAEELVLHVMSAEVNVIIAKLAGNATVPAKVMSSIEHSLDHLERDLDSVLARLPSDRTLSFLEVTLFCLVTHLPFRQVLDTARWTQLTAFAQRFGERPSARSTEYRFDAA
jgi:glutathione S-transferase